jgi:TRAP-type transport system periplasmic protein
MSRNGGATLKSKSQAISRRDFHRLVGAFGATAVYGVLAKSANAAESLNAFAQRVKLAASEQKKVAAKSQVTLRFGISGQTPATTQVYKLGIYEFKEEVARRTNGAVNIELLGGNSVCTELTCIQKALAGSIQGFLSSTQNAANTVPFYNCLDFPYMFPSRASMFHFFYHPKSEASFRKPLREKYNVEFLWTACELRNIYMGLAWRDKVRVRRPSQIEGAKIRVTGSDLGRIALGLFGVNPIPLDWAETLEGLKSGLVDGQESMSVPAAAFNMGGVTSQDVGIEFFAGTEHTAMDARVFAKLESSIQKAIKDSAFVMQQFTQRENEKSLRDLVGMQDPPKAGTIWAKHGVKVNILTSAEKAEWEMKASPRSNPKPYEKWRERITKLSGGVDVYSEIYKIAREIPPGTPVEAVTPRH